MNKKCV